MAKKIYIGEILGEVMSKVEALQVDMQNVANQMIEVATNTSYLQNLYLMEGRRNVITYSQGDDTLQARKSATNVPLKIDNIVTLAGGATENTTTCTLGGPDNSTATFNCTGLDEIKFLPTFTGYTFGAVTMELYVDDVLIQSKFVGMKQTVVGDPVVIDVSALSTTILKFVTGGGSCTLSKIVLVYSDGKIEALYPGESAAIVNKKITIATYYESALFTLKPITGITWGGWDCVTWKINNDNGFTKVSVLSSDGTLLIDDLKSGEALTSISTLDFYLLFHIQEDNSLVPELEAVSYLYLE